jgi:transcriptional regulator with XRE-family HTH domain
MGKFKNRIPELIQRKGLRDNKRYSQRDLARGAGVSDNAVSRLMRYQTLDNIPLGHALAIAKWLEVAVEDLVRESENE